MDLLIKVKKSCMEVIRLLNNIPSLVYLQNLLNKYNTSCFIS